METTDPTRSPDLTGRLVAACAILRSAKAPVFAGLTTDVDGVRAVLMLAGEIGASVDHAAGRVMTSDLRVFADTGQMTTTPAETRHRADLIILTGRGSEQHARAVGLLVDTDPIYAWRGTRKVISLPAASLLGQLAAVRAQLAGRPARHWTDADADVLVALKAAQFGVIVYDPSELDAITVEMLHGLVKDLNETARFSTLPVPGPFNARAAHTIAAWTTGGPLRVGFGRGYADQDDWLHDAERLVTSGEADALVWIGALAPDLPAYAGQIPTIALVPPGSDTAATVVIPVGVPGRDHGATLYEPMRDGMTYMPATAPSDLPSVAQVIGQLAIACREGSRSC